MSRRSELPEDLDRLGLFLEVAVSDAVRRRNRRQAVMNFAGAVALSVPFAIAVAAADLSPSDAFSPQPATMGLAVQPPSDSFMVVRHIRDEPLPATSKVPCLDARDCRSPLPPSNSPAPAGRR